MATPDPAEPFWFLNSLVTVRVSEADGSDSLSVIEHRVSHGDSPPLHVHHTEDEVFHILDGEFRLLVGGREQRAGPGDVRLIPKGVPHTYRCETAPGGRFLTITARGEFEKFVRAMGRPAERAGVPEPSGPLSAEAVRVLTEVAARFGIEFVGPPLG